MKNPVAEAPELRSGASSHSNKFEPYRAYKARPLTKEQRKDVTFLFGGLTWKHERLLEGAFQNMGLKAEALPNVERADLDTGKEMIDAGACCPTTFVTGNLANYLKKKVESEGKDAAVNKYAYLTAGACGACRFGQYHESYNMALDAMGLKDFRIFLLAQDKMDQGETEGGAIDMSMPFTTAAYMAVLVGDILTDLEYITRPYEVVPGTTDRVLKECADYLYGVFKNRPIVGKKWGSLLWNLTTPYFTNALKEVGKRWATIEVDRLRMKPKVKITGEFWLQTHEGDGNYNIKRWLEKEGAELIPPPIVVWIDYLIRADLVQTLEARREVTKYAGFKIWLGKMAQRMLHYLYNRLRKAIGYIPYYVPDQYEIRKLAEPYFHMRLSGGEGDMLVGKSIMAYQKKTAHMICELSPYSCMPNTMSIGAMANVLGKYPDLLYAPIEVKGDAEVHAISRCQMILTEARKRSQAEYDSVLAGLGLTEGKIREYEAKHPELRQATYRIPHYGVAGTAANYAIHIAKKMGIKNSYKESSVYGKLG